MNDKKQKNMLKQTSIERYNELQRKKNEILQLEPKEALKRILDTPQPAALVHAFPEEDFYFLMHDLGAEEALPLLALASDNQVEFILDMEIWQRDRIKIDSVTHWFDLLFRADPNRFVNRFVGQKNEFVEYYLFRNIEVLIREHDQDPSDFDKSFFTFDDTFYIRFLEHPLEPNEDTSDDIKTAASKRDTFLLELIRRLAENDHKKFQQMLLEAASILPAESEEESFRLRNVRLAEKGFLPFDEAVGIYQYLNPEQFKSTKLKRPPRAADQRLPVPFFHFRPLDPDSHFARVLKTIETEDRLREIQAEFASLCNQLIVADQKIIRERPQLSEMVRKACAYLGIGLHRLSSDPAGISPKESAELLARYPLVDIFRTGFGMALELKWQAEKWQKISWFGQNGLPLSFWGESWVGVLGGLLIKKPLYFDNDSTGSLYRDFLSVEEIEMTGKVLAQIMAFDHLMSRLDLQIRPAQVTIELNYKNLLLTLWARARLGLSDKVEPIRREEFKPFYKWLWNRSGSRKISSKAKETFLGWIAERSGLTVQLLSQTMGRAFEDLFDELEVEYGQVRPEDVDAKYITLFLLSP